MIKCRKSVVRETVVIALPLIIQGIVYQLQSATDKAFLGHLETGYVSAIGAAQLPFNAVLSSIISMAIGITIIVAHMYGAGEKKESVKYVKSAMLYNSLICSAIFLLWQLYAYPILKFFKVDPLVIDYSVQYVKICAFYVLGVGIDSSLSAMLQGLGKTKIIMYCGCIKVFFNIFISWVLIFGKLGFKAYYVAGAAIGTLLSNIIAFAFICLYCFVIKRKELGLDNVKAKDFAFANYKRVFSLGAPAGIEDMLWCFSNLVLVRFINEFSYIDMSIYTITCSIQYLIVAIFLNYARGALTLIGQSLGAGDKEKAKDVFYSAIIINFGIIIFIDVFFVLFPRQILGLFITDQAVIERAVKYLLFAGLIMLPQNLNITCGNAIKGNFNTRWMLLSQIFGSTFVICLSIVFVRVLHLKLESIYLVIFLDEFIRGSVNLIYYKRKYLNNYD